jgi:isopropylmalate/homocitrate/citramalate synthase
MEVVAGACTFAHQDDYEKINDKLKGKVLIMDSPNEFEIEEMLDTLKPDLFLTELEWHGHNDFGMATANALAAVKAGIECVDTTIGGIGERAGNTCLEEFVAALQGVYGLSLDLDRRVLQALSRYVPRAAGRSDRTGPPRFLKLANGAQAN